MILVIIFLALTIGFFECIPLIRRGMKKELYVVLFILLSSVLFQFCSKYKIFVLKNLVESILGPIGKVVFKKM